MKFLPALFFLLPVIRSQTCSPRLSLQPTDSVGGVLDLADCRLSDNTPYAQYSLVLPARGTIQLDGSVPLILRDSAFRQIGAGLSFSRPVERGPYIVVVYAPAPDQLGAFTLRSTFTPQPASICRGFASIGLNQALAARLTASSCVLPDSTPYDGYTLTSFGAGALTVNLQSDSFDAYVILRTSDGFELSSADAGAPGATAQIATDILDNQTYTIVASAGDSGLGAYNLSVSFTPADDETCRPLQGFTVTASAQDTISADSCSYATADPNAHISFNYYDLEVTQPGVAEIRLTTDAFTPYLQLLDASGSVIQSDSYSGGLGTAIVRQQLNPGSYTVQAFSVDMPGDYTLQYTFTPLGPAGTAVCPSLQVDPGALTTGAFTPDSCRTVEGPSQVYAVAMPAAGTIDIDMQSTDFVPLLTLRDAKDNHIVTDDNFGNITDSHITADLPTGTYSIVAASGGLPGAYTFTYKIAPHDLTPCTQVQNLDPSSAYIGVFSAASCRGPNGQPIDYYQITMPVDGTIAAVMTSQVIDSFLTLQPADGASTLRWDSNSYEGSNALIVQFLPAGTYRIAAQATDAVASGFYRLDLLFAPGGPPAGCASLRVVNPGDSVSASLGFASCMYPGDTFADLYQITLTDVTALDLRLNSSAFDAYLVVLDSKGNVVDADDNSGGGSNAEIVDSFDPGTYTIVARPFSGYAATGAYLLTVTPAQ